MTGYKKEHLREAESVRGKDGQRFRNQKENSLQIVEKCQKIVP